MNDKSREDHELEPRAKKSRREKDSSGAMRHGFSRAQRAFAGRLSRPGYVAACHSRKPEAMVKVVANAPRGHAVRQLLHYISRTQGQDLKDQEAGNVYLVDHEGCQYTGRADVERLASEWFEKSQDEYGVLEDRQQADTKRKIREVQHVVLSAKADKNQQNFDLVLAAAKETARTQFAGHEYVIGLHQDGKCPHVHIVVRCAPINRKHNKLRLNKPELLQLRTVWAKDLSRVGLEHVATLRQDRPHVMEQVAKGRATLRGKRMTWFQASLAGMAEGQEFFEKRQNDLTSALERLGGREEAQKIREEIGLRINDLRQHIRASTKKGDQERLEAFNELRKIERSLQKQADPLLRFHKLAEQAGTHRPAYDYIAQSLESGKRLPVSSQPPKSASEIQIALEFHQRGVDQARAEVKKFGGMNREQYALAMKVLEIHDATVRKALGVETRPAKTPIKPQAEKPIEKIPAVVPTKTRDSGIER